MPRIDLLTHTLFINVRELVSFLFPERYQDDEFLSPVRLNFLRLGQIWHTRVQSGFMRLKEKNINIFCSTEIFVSHTFNVGSDWQANVRGRLDALFYDESKKKFKITEIKTINKLKSDHEIREEWILQLKFYLWLLVNANPILLEKIFQLLEISANTEWPSLGNLQGELYVVNTITKEHWINDVVDISENLEQKFFEALDKSLHYFLPRILHMEHLQLINTIPWFFSDYRPEQFYNLTIIQKALIDKPFLLLAGPPGTGKTALSLYALLKTALGKKQIFYATAKNTQQHEALELLHKMNIQVSPPLWVVTIVAKEKFCITGTEYCNPTICSYFQAMIDEPVSYSELFGPQPILDVLTLQNLARTTGKFCPYYQAKHLIGYADVVIGDQNYIFDSLTRLRYLDRRTHPLLFTAKGLPYYYIFDEAHNLAERLRKLASYQLDLSIFEDIQMQLKDIRNSVLDRKKKLQLYNLFLQSKSFLTNLPIVQTPSLATSLTTAAKLLETIPDKPSNGNGEQLLYLQYNSDEGEYRAIQVSLSMVQQIREITQNHSTHLMEFNEKLLAIKDTGPIETKFFDSWLKLVENFSHIEDAFETINSPLPRYQFFYQSSKNKKVIEAYCLDIASILHESLVNSPGAVLMSATLFPESYYRMIFSLSEKTANNLAHDPPFSVDNRLSIIIDDFNTRFIERSTNLNEFLDRLAEWMKDLQASYHGTYLVFLPNLDMIAQLVPILRVKGLVVYAQNEFSLGVVPAIDSFLIGALGSIYSEGVNILGLKGVIIVSPGTLPPSYRQNLLLEYYKQKTGNNQQDSFVLSYIYPGMTKVMQAAGRLHRSPEDKGIIFLVCERFKIPPYNLFVPAFMQPIKVTNSSEYLKELKTFWQKHQ